MNDEPIYKIGVNPWTEEMLVAGRTLTCGFTLSELRALNRHRDVFTVIRNPDGDTLWPCLKEGCEWPDDPELPPHV